MLGFSERGPLVDVIRTDFRQDVETLYSLLPQEMKDRLVSVVETALTDKSPGCKKKAA